jgi:putative transposase
MSHKFHKKIRLEKSIYNQTANACSITMCTNNRQAVFKCEDFSMTCIELLRAYFQKHHIPIFAYCFMPDHLHLLLSSSPNKDIVNFVREYKSLTTRLSWNYDLEGTLWQKSFFDHFLRKEESLNKVAQYTLDNPVRKNIVRVWHEYPFSGSFVFALKRSGG